MTVLGSPSVSSRLFQSCLMLNCAHRRTVRLRFGALWAGARHLFVVAAGEPLVQGDELAVYWEPREEGARDGLALEDDVVARLLVHVMTQLQSAGACADDAVVERLVQRQRRRRRRRAPERRAQRKLRGEQQEREPRQRQLPLHLRDAQLPPEELPEGRLQAAGAAAGAEQQCRQL